DPDPPGLLPVYKTYRALVRAKVNALLSEETEVPGAAREAGARRARRYFRLAGRIARWRGGPALIVMGGLTGTGKTRIARDIARRYGAEWVATDVLRKLIAGRDPFEPAGAGPGKGLYRPAHRRATMRAVMREASALLRAGRPVVLDGSFQSAGDRAAARRLAARLGVRVHFFWCEAPEAIIRGRFNLRRKRPAISDGTWPVFLSQRRTYDPPVELNSEVLTRLDTSRSLRVLQRRVDGVLAPLAVCPGRRPVSAQKLHP
ncbi:MAG: AAA family ATPase, partial [Myxococcota bacterium]